MVLNLKCSAFRTELILEKIKFSVWCILLFPAFVLGQGNSDVDPDIAETKTNLAPVRIDGEILFYVRGVAAYPADTRAKTIQKRIYAVAKNKSIPPDSVRLVVEESRIRIFAMDQFIMNVYNEDAEIDGINKELEAEITTAKIKEIIKLYRHERTPSVIKANALKALIGVVLLIAILVIFSWLFRKLNEAFKRRIQTKIEHLENVSFKLIQSDQLIRILQILYQTIKVILILVITIGFIDYVLALFPWTKSGSAYLLQLFLDPLKSIFNGFIDYLPSLAFLIVIFMVTRYLIKLIKLLFNGLEEGAINIEGFDPEWAMPTFKIFKLLTIIFALVVAFPYIPGSSTGAFKGISVFLGILFSLGSSSFISNMIAGYSMTYRRAFKRGDRIQAGTLEGYVEEQSLMVTRLRSVKNEEIVIPNSILLNSSVVNYNTRAKTEGVILHTTVGIGYETPWRQVEAMLLLAADKTEGLLKNPPPYVLKKELGSFDITYEINVYCDDASKLYIYYSSLHEHILDIFNENNVQIMTPAYKADPETPKVVPKAFWNIPLAGETGSANQTDKS